MDQQTRNKEIVLEYFNALSGKAKPRELLEQYVEDEELLNHIEFFETVLPKYEIGADELIAEGNRVVVKARGKGRHEGEFNGIPPTHKEVDFGFVICYYFENNKIVH